MRGIGAQVAGQEIKLAAEAKVPCHRVRIEAVPRSLLRPWIDC